jgi:putative DNA primase/helicase
VTNEELDQCRHNPALLHDIISRQVTLKREGNHWKGRCPFHDDSDPSFAVYDNAFRCFACGAKGSVFDYVMRRDHVDFARAVEIVATEAGIKSKANGRGRHHDALWQPILPVPGDAPRPTDRLACDALHEYHDAEDRLLFYVRRIEAKDGTRKQFYPLTYGVLNGKRGWHNKAPDAPRPLYRLNALSHAKADATVLQVEGEKAADAAEHLFPDYVAMTWSGGANADRGADFSPLSGRAVILWPDADDAGRNATARIAKQLPQAQVVDTAGLPDGFDAADLEASGCNDPEVWLQKRLRDTEAPPERQQPHPAAPPLAPEPGAPEPPPPDAGDVPQANPLQAAIDRLAMMPELDFDRIKQMKAEEFGLDASTLTRAVARARRDEAKAREAEARAAEKARKIAEASERLDAQKARTLHSDKEHDGLSGWLPPPSDALPKIIVAGGERPNVADAGLAAMAAARVPFYQRGKDLVRVCLVKLKLSNGGDVRAPAVSIVTRPMLMRALGRCAIWQAHNKELDLVHIDPPRDLGDHILGMIGEWPFPPLRGVIATQTMRYDGTLLTEPGYDPATGLVLFNPPPMPVIPDQPTKHDALDGLALIRDLLIEVDFAEDESVSLSGAVSMVMTPVLRGMMSVAPMHVVTKPVAGTGGSYLQDIVAAIAIGERCPVISLTPNNDEENEKRLSSAALTGQSIIAIDNFTGTLMGDFLCQLIERPMPQVRLLGKSELVTTTNNHCVLANGNNVTIGADAVRRTVQIALDANREDPTTRTFTRDPVAMVLADRGKYIAAILTIARAYRVAGSPGKLAPRLSFGEWSDNVRSALVWLGWPDPDASIKTVRAADPVSSKLHAVIAAWVDELDVNVGYYTSELVDRASQYVGGGSNDRVRPALWDALFNVAANKNNQLDPRALGVWLEAHLNRISAGHKLQVDRETNKARPRWSVVPR